MDIPQRAPLLVDLFCGAGGASVGYHRAGFDILGVDHKPQPRYPFPFVQSDALEWLASADLSEVDAIHASPPCQAYSAANNIHRRTDHPDLIEPTRRVLRKTGLPYVIENVPGAPLRQPYVLCGLALGLNVKRHRLFETDLTMLVPPCQRGHPGDWLLVFGHTVLERRHQSGRTVKDGPILHRRHVSTDRGRKAMGIDWMNRDELSQAIPPEYTKFIGGWLLAAITESRVV